MLGFNRIKGFLRRFGIRDGNAAPSGPTPAQNKSTGASSTAAGSGGGGANGPADTCAFLAGLPPNAGSQAILQRIDQFIATRSVGGQPDATEAAREVDVKARADGNAVIAQSMDGAEHSTSVDGAPSLSDADGHEMSDASIGTVSTSIAPMDPALARMLTSFPEGVLTPRQMDSPTANTKIAPRGTRKGPVPPPLLSTSAQSRSSVGGTLSDAPFYTRFRARYPSVSAACAVGTSPFGSVPASPAHSSAGSAAGPTNANASSAAAIGGVAGCGEGGDLLALLLKERADVLDALDICIQEVPYTVLTTKTCADDATTDAQATVAAVCASEPTSASPSPALVPEKTGLSSQPASQQPSRRTSAGNNAGVDKSISAAGAVASGRMGAEEGAKVYDMHEWRALLLRIVELLIDVDQAVCLERHLRAIASAGAATSALSGATSAAVEQPVSEASTSAVDGAKTTALASGQDTSKKSAAATKSTDVPKGLTDQVIEALLATECALATWVVLRHVLQQQVAAAAAEKRRARSDRRTSDSGPTVSTASATDTQTIAPSPDNASPHHTAERPTSDIQTNSHDSVDHVLAGVSGALSNEEVLYQLLSRAPLRSRIVVDWHKVIHELQGILGFIDPSTAECIVCASFLHDDNRELMINIIQYPLPRVLFDRVSSHKRREPVKPVIPPISVSVSPSTTTTTVDGAAAPAASSIATGPTVSGSGSTLTAAAPTNTAAPTPATTSAPSAESGNDLDLTMDDLVAASTHLYTDAIVRTWQQYLEERALLAGVVHNQRMQVSEPTSFSANASAHSSGFSSPLSAVDSRRESGHSMARPSMTLPVPLPHTDVAALNTSNTGNRPDKKAADSAMASVGTSPAPADRNRSREVSTSFDRSPQQPMLTARPSEAGQTVPNISTDMTPPTVSVEPAGEAMTDSQMHTPNTKTAALSDGAADEAGPTPKMTTPPSSVATRRTTATPSVSANNNNNNFKAMFSFATPGCTELITPLNSDDPFIFCRVATAFTFGAVDLTENNREAVFAFLRSGIGARLASTLAAARTRSAAARRGTTVSGGHRSGNRTAPSSHVATPRTDALVPTHTDASTALSDALYDWVTSAVEAAAAQRAASHPQWMLSSAYARLHAAVFERVLLLAWTSALHKKVDLCLRARPPHLDAACEAAAEENAAASVCHHFHSGQLALTSLVRANLAVGKNHDALAAARKHFKREKKAWTSNAQTVFTAIGYLQSMVQLVQAQAACSAYAGVIETGQFVLQQTVLCSQMLAAVAPKPNQAFVLRYGSCHAKLLHSRCFLLHEVWCAHASFNDVEKTQRYFTEYINSLAWIQKHVREQALFDAYMERGSQLLKNKKHAEALEQFTAAVEVAKKCISENEAMLAAKARAKASTTASRRDATGRPHAHSHHSNARVGMSGEEPSGVSSVPRLSLPCMGSDALPYIPRITTATGGWAQDTNAAKPHDTQQEAEEAADLERTLDLQWHLAESERMMSLSLVAMAENEVNVRAQRDELSHAVNSAYASQSSLQKWQAKGGSPKRLLTGGPSNLIVMCRALLLLNQPRKAAVLLEPLVEDKGAYASIRPPRWKEILEPTGQPLTAEDIALCVFVNSVRITVYGLYVQSLSRFDGERALRAAQHVRELLEESDNWVQGIRLLIRGKQIEVHQTRFSRSTSVFHAAGGAGSVETSPAAGKAVGPMTTLPGVQSQPPSRAVSDGVLSSQISTAVERSPVPIDLQGHVTGLRSPSKAASATSEENEDNVSDRASSVIAAAPPLPTAGIPAKSLGAGAGVYGDAVGQRGVSTEYPFPTASQTSPLTGSSAAVSIFPSIAAAPSLVSGTSTNATSNGFSVQLDSRSERVTALRALSQASLDITTGYRELSVTYGDAYCFLERWEDALSAYSQAMALCQVEEDLALRSSAGLTNAMAAGGAASSSRVSSHVVSPTVANQFNAVDGLEELLAQENEADGGIMDIETMDPKMARNLREMLVHGTRVDYHANANAVNARLARVHTALNKLSTAMDYYELVLDFAVETDDKLLQYKSLLALARLYTRTHATAKAHETWEHVSALAHAYQDTTVGRETLRNIIAANEASGMFYEVIAHADQLNKLSSNVEGSEAMADRRFALEALAHAYLELAQYKECHGALDEREKVQEKAVEWNGRLMSLRAQAYIGQGDIADAIKVLLCYVHKARMLSNWSELGKANAGLAKAYASGDNLFKARRSYMAALRAFALHGPLKAEEREVVLQATRWLVHYFYLSDEEVQVSAGLVYEPEVLRRGAGGSGTNGGANASMVEEVDETLEGRTTFDYDLHNNSGDLSQMLEEDETKRRTMSSDDFDDDFGGAFDGSWGDEDGGRDDLFSGQSFAAADLSSILTSSKAGEKVKEEVDGGSAGEEDRSSTVPAGTEDRKTNSSSHSEAGASADQSSEDSRESTSSAESPSPSSTTTATAASTSKPTTATTTTTTTGAPRGGLQPAPTTIAHISFCSRPAAAAGGSDALDGSHGGRGDGAAPDAETSNGPKTGADAPASSSSTETEERTNDSNAKAASSTRGKTPAAADGTLTAAGSAGVGSGGVVTALSAAAQRERRARPAKVVTLHYRAALETMEWTWRLLLNGDPVLNYRPSILYAPAEAVDLVLLTHPRTTFVFYFAEYTMESSSCYDVVVRPAHTSNFFHRSAQVTTLRAYQSKTIHDDISVSRDAQARAKTAMATFGASNAKDAAATTEVSGTGASAAPVVSAAEEEGELARLIDDDTCKRLYDLHEELWSGVASGLRRIDRTLEDAESVVLVPDATLLHVPFNALMPNPDTVMPGDSTAPIGEQATLVVVPSLAHMAQHAMSRSDVFARRMTLPPLLSSARDRKPVFLPEEFEPRRRLMNNKSTDSVLPLESLGSAVAVTPTSTSASAVVGATYVRVSTTRRTSMGSITHPLQAGSEASSSAALPPRPLPSTTAGTGAGATNGQNTTIAYPSSGVNSTSLRSSNVNNDEESSPLQARWSVHYGCTRKELIHAFSDTTTRAIMVLCDVKDHTLVTGDGTVDFKELCQPITASLDAMSEPALAATGRTLKLPHPPRYRVASASASFMSSPLDGGLSSSAARLPRAVMGAIPAGHSSALSSPAPSSVNVGAANAHGLVPSPGAATTTAASVSSANAATMTATPAPPPSNSLSNMAVGSSLSNTTAATVGPTGSGVNAAVNSRPVLPEDVCLNLELVVLTCDRSATTNAGEPGLAARLCLQLGCARVLRVDLISGQSFSNAHHDFMNSYLTFLEKAQRWNLDGAYAVALRSTIADARAQGVSSTVWGAFTLVGAP